MLFTMAKQYTKKRSGGKITARYPKKRAFKRTLKKGSSSAASVAKLGAIVDARILRSA